MPRNKKSQPAVTGAAKPAPKPATKKPPQIPPAESANKPPAPKPSRSAYAGRKPRDTPERIGVILNVLRSGNPYKDACAAAGIDQSTFYKWLNDPKKAAFKQAVEEAEAEARRNATAAVTAAYNPQEEIRTVTDRIEETRFDKDGNPYQYVSVKTHTTVIQRPGDWRAGIEFLRRRDKENWSDRRELTGKDGNPIEGVLTLKDALGMDDAENPPKGFE